MLHSHSRSSFAQSYAYKLQLAIQLLLKLKLKLFCWTCALVFSGPAGLGRRHTLWAVTVCFSLSCLLYRYLPLSFFLFLAFLPLSLSHHIHTHARTCVLRLQLLLFHYACFFSKQVGSFVAQRLVCELIISVELICARDRSCMSGDCMLCVVFVTVAAVAA